MGLPTLSAGTIVAIFTNPCFILVLNRKILRANIANVGRNIVMFALIFYGKYANLALFATPGLSLYIIRGLFGCAYKKWRDRSLSISFCIPESGSVDVLWLSLVCDD